MPPKAGLTIMEMMQGCIDGKIKGMVILGENPVMSDPDSNHVKHALESAEFFMAIDIFPTPTTDWPTWYCLRRPLPKWTDVHQFRAARAEGAKGD